MQKMVPALQIIFLPILWVRMGTNAVLKSSEKIAMFRLLSWSCPAWVGMLHLSEDSSPETSWTLLKTQSTWRPEMLYLTHPNQSQVSCHKPRATSGLRIETRNDRWQKPVGFPWIFQTVLINVITMPFVILIVRSFFFPILLSDSSEITHPKKVLFFFFFF